MEAQRLGLAAAEPELDVLERAAGSCCWKWGSRCSAAGARGAGVGGGILVLEMELEVLRGGKWRCLAAGAGGSGRGEIEVPLPAGGNTCRSSSRWRWIASSVRRTGVVCNDYIFGKGLIVKLICSQKFSPRDK